MAIKVLLVDDDQEFLDILSERLTIRGMDVTTAASAKAALTLVQEAPFDVVMLDLQMPEMDGLQALEQLTAINPALRIILLTGHATVARGVQAMKLGAVDVVEKPADIRGLVEKIRTASVRNPHSANGYATGSSLPRPSRVAKLLSALGNIFKKSGQP